MRGGIVVNIVILTDQGCFERWGFFGGLDVVGYGSTNGFVLTRDTVGACCCTASSGVSFLWGISSCEGSETNMSCKKVSLRWYLRSLLRGDCVGVTCGIGGSCVGY